MNANKSNVSLFVPTMNSSEFSRKRLSNILSGYTPLRLTHHGSRLITTSSLANMLF